MRTRVLVAASLVIAIALAAWLVDFRHGSTLEDGEGSFTIGMTTVRKGDDVYFMAPTPSNQSNHSIKLVSVAPGTASPGLEFVDARIYQRADFMDQPWLSWATGNGGLYTPPNTKSSPVSGQELAGDHTLDAIIYLHFRVTTDQRPLQASGVRFTYHRGFRNHTQTLNAVFDLAQKTNTP